MHNVERLEDGLTGMAGVAACLHDLCQPLTALQCRLELAGMDPDPVAMRASVEEALRECYRLNRGVHAMQRTLRDEMAKN